MALIKPFRALLYNSKKVNVEDVVAPPYDVISKNTQNLLYESSPYNIVRLILGKSYPFDNSNHNKYTRADNLIKEWLKKDILIQGESPCIYIYGQDYLHEEKLRKRHGFICLMKLEDLNKGVVFGHENTFDKPKKDRLKLLEATGANLSPIFALFSDKEKKAEGLIKERIRKRPDLDMHFNGVGERLWRVCDKKTISKIKEILKNKQVFIADGHHRYEAALFYRNKKRQGAKDQPSEYIMIYLCSLENKGLTILSTHRMARGIRKERLKNLFCSLGEFFEIKKVKNKKQLFSKMQKYKDCEHFFGLYTQDDHFYLLSLKDEAILDRIALSGASGHYNRLDASILHNLIFKRILKMDQKKDFKNIGFERDEDLAIKSVRKKKFQLGFFLNPVKINQVRDIAIALDRMPHKSTYFYPKLLSGLVLYKMDM